MRYWIHYGKGWSMTHTSTADRAQAAALKSQLTAAGYVVTVFDRLDNNKDITAEL